MYLIWLYCLANEFSASKCNRLSSLNYYLLKGRLINQIIKTLLFRNLLCPFC